MRRMLRLAGYVLVTSVGLAGLGVAIQLGAAWLVQGQSAAVAKSTTDARLSLIQFIGGVGLLGGLAYTVRNFGLARGTQRADRFTKAVGQLGDSESRTVRVGGAYGLGVLASEEASYWPYVTDVLSAMVRERASSRPLQADVQAALSVLCDRPKRYSLKRPTDLRGVDLSGARLVNANLEGTGLADVKLAGAELSGARLNTADLTDSDLRGSTLAKASLRGADLSSADLRDADLTGADLTGATVYRTKFANAAMKGAKLARVKGLSPDQLSPEQRVNARVVSSAKMHS